MTILRGGIIALTFFFSGAAAAITIDFEGVASPGGIQSLPYSQDGFTLISTFTTVFVVDSAAGGLFNTNGTDVVGFKAPDAVNAGDTFWTLPPGDGVADQVFAGCIGVGAIVQHGGSDVAVEVDIVNVG
jgi:hypothetical protein